MAGFRDFQTGEVLTASNVNDFLMQQSVMKFADAAARDSALGTAVGGGNALREGMVAYLDSTDDVLKYDGSAWAALGAAGIGSNVVQTVKTDTFSTTSSSFTTVTGLTVTITPTSNTSKVLIIANVGLGHSNDAGGYILKISGGNTATYVGDAASNRTRGIFGLENSNAVLEHIRLLTQTMVYLDSPATTSATTYSVECVQTRTGTLYVNRTGADGDNSDFPRGASTITAIEVAA